MRSRYAPWTPRRKALRRSKRATDPTAGDCWTWTAIEADTKLLVSYLIGGRDGEYALVLMDDLLSRLANRIQLMTDGHKSYLQAVEAFGADIVYGMLVKAGCTDQFDNRSAWP
jgi:transposase-like protein